MASPRSAVSRVVALLLIFTISGAVWAAPARTLKQYDIRAAHKMRPALRRWHNGPSASKSYHPPSTVYHAPRATGLSESKLQPNAQEMGGSAFLTTRAVVVAPAEKTANAFAAYRTGTPSFNQRGEGYLVGSTGHKPHQNERKRASNN